MFYFFILLTSSFSICSFSSTSFSCASLLPSSCFSCYLEIANSKRSYFPPLSLSFLLFLLWLLPLLLSFFIIPVFGLILLLSFLFLFLLLLFLLLFHLLHLLFPRPLTLVWPGCSREHFGQSSSSNRQMPKMFLSLFSLFSIRFCWHLSHLRIFPSLALFKHIQSCIWIYMGYLCKLGTAALPLCLISSREEKPGRHFVHTMLQWIASNLPPPPFFLFLYFFVLSLSASPKLHVRSSLRCLFIPCRWLLRLHGRSVSC